jgi:DNA-binding NtrC family response regulator
LTSKTQGNGVVLVVDDDPSLRRLVSHWLSRAGYEVEEAANGAAALRLLAHVIPDVLLMDVEMPGKSGVDTLKALRKREPHLPVVMLTADTGVDTVVASMQLGAYDYLNKPPQKQRLINAVERAAEHSRMAVRMRHLEREASGEPGYPGIVGESAPMRALYRELDRVTAADITVLVSGESGTGKELVAQALHEASGRADGPFVAINCAAIPDTLQESELFGHEKGAFTGAQNRREGRFEQADGGTLFLDEIAELSLAAQAQLLRALQERRFFRVGGDREISSDFRLVAATNRDLLAEVRTGRFREDLYYRVAVYEIQLPPLRERERDAVLIAHELVRTFASKIGIAEPILTAEAATVIAGYEWPGNVRELQNAVQRAIVAAGSDDIGPQHLPSAVTGAAPLSVLKAKTSEKPLAEEHSSSVDFLSAFESFPTIAQVERYVIERAIAKSDGNLSEAVRLLGIGRTTLYRKLEKYGVNAE